MTFSKFTDFRVVDSVQTQAKAIVNRELEMDFLDKEGKKTDWVILDSSSKYNKDLDPVEDSAVRVDSASPIEKYVEPQTLTRVLTVTSTITTLEGCSSFVVETANAIMKRVQGAKDFLRSFKQNFGIIFGVANVVLSIYSMYEDTRRAFKSYWIKDYEGVRDHAANTTSSTLNLSSSLLGITAYVLYKTKFVVSSIAAGAITVTSSCLGAGAFAVYGAIQFVSLRRILRSLDRIKKIFNKSTSETEKYIESLKDFKAQLILTPAEERKIQDKYQDIECELEQQNKISTAIQNLQLKKYKRLARRVGPNMAKEIKDLFLEKNGGISKFETFTRDLIGGDQAAKNEACEKVGQLLKSYRLSLMKNLALTALKMAGALVGTIGVLVALASPLGAGVLMGVSSVILLTAVYRTNFWKYEKLEDTTVFGFSLYNIKIPELDQSFKAKKA